MEFIRAFLEAHFLSLISNIFAGIMMILLSQAAWRSGMPKDENLKLSVGGLITIVMGLLAPGSFLPMTMGLTWILITYLRLEKIESPHLWSIAALMGMGVVILSFTILSPMVLSWVSSALGLAFGLFVTAQSLKKVSLAK